MEKRFPALHTVSAIFKILAWLVAIVDIIIVVLVLMKKFALTALSGPPAVLAAGILLAGAIYFLFLYAFAEGILVVVAIEENTRKTAQEKP